MQNICKHTRRCLNGVSRCHGISPSMLVNPEDDELAGFWRSGNSGVQMEHDRSVCAPNPNFESSIPSPCSSACTDAGVGSSQSSYSCTPKIICDLYHVHYIKGSWSGGHRGPKRLLYKSNKVSRDACGTCCCKATR